MKFWRLRISVIPSDIIQMGFKQWRGALWRKTNGVILDEVHIEIPADVATVLVHIFAFLTKWNKK